jgi:type IV secretion system protein VirB5
MVFRRPTPTYAHTPAPVTPYQRAAQAWDDRIGSARVQARNWRLMAFGSLMLSSGLAIALVWQSSRGQLVPWVIEVSPEGQAISRGPADATLTPTDAQISWHLRRFIEQVRSIPADPVVLRQNWLGAYAFTTERGAQALNAHARAEDPFARIATTQVTVEVSSVIRASPDSFRLSWIERSFEAGALARTERWSAILTLTLSPPRDAERLMQNPLGIYVHALNWSREIAP